MRHLVVAMQARNNPLNRWFPWRKAYRDLMYWGGRMSDLVVDLTADMEARPPPPHSLGAHMLACSMHGTGLPLERLQVMTELGVLWGAGFETTAHTICWTLLLVASHPAVEARLLGELASLGLSAAPQQPQPAQLKWEHLAQLRYLSAVINESMRLYPVVSSGTIRITHKPMQLGPYSLPAGQPVLIPFFSIHRSPSLWEDPDAFKPERWLAGEAAAADTAGAGAAGRTADAAGASSGSTETQTTAAAAAAAPAGVAPEEDDDYVDVAADISAFKDQAPQQQQRGTKERKVQPTAAGAAAQPAAAKPGGSGLEIKDPSVSRRGFLPFSEGSRSCVGQALALVELKAVLAMLLGNFTFRLTPEMGGFAGVDEDARQAITLRPEHGLMMTLRHRSLA
ncbi:cytochrome P450 [Scenedesmus sp. NREL 46B-D3]|nr:cytochrome P450 [Scenedesmus sp. NREL 46B-D3]